MRFEFITVALVNSTVIFDGKSRMLFWSEFARDFETE
jgi:hypothetical protein